jgi:signal transduction histidine kinase
MFAGFSVWPSWRGWFLADVLASLVLAPTILLCISGRVWSPTLRSRRRAAEAGVLFLALLAVGAFIFGTQSQDKDTAPALLYLPVPLLVWAAVRFGPHGLTFALSLTTVLAIAGVANGLGPFVELPEPASTLQLQLFLLGVGVPLFCLAVLVQEHHRASALAINEAALRVTNEQLAELSRAKSDFLSIVSHEVRTPLGSIRGFSEMIRDDPLEPGEVFEYASFISTEARRLGRLVDDLLDLDRLESGRIELRVESIDIGAIVADAFEQARPTSNGHVLKAVLTPGIPNLRGDRDKLTQVVANLVGNAIKYSPNGGAVTLSADIVDDGVHLWVRDEGIGIPSEMLEVIFDRYTRVESAEHRAIKGTGLGLPIVRQIAELHGGRAWAESTPGHGSTFHVMLPIDGLPARQPVPGPDGEGKAR